MNRRVFLKQSATAGAMLAAAPSFLMMEGCSTPESLAALLAALSNAAVMVATDLGNTALAARIKTAAAAAVTAVLNWKSGTPAQDVVEVLTILESDLNLLPFSTIYEELIQLALGTIVTIIEIINPGAMPVSASVTLKAKTGQRTVTAQKWHSWQKPKSEFVSRWNKIVASNAALAGVKL